MARQLFNKHAEKYYYCYELIHISTLISIITILQLLYSAYISLLALSSLNSYSVGIIKIICVIISVLIINFVYGALFINSVCKKCERYCRKFCNKESGWYWPCGILWAICSCNSSIGSLFSSLIMLYFWDYDEKLISTIKSDLRFYYLPETLMEPEDYYYLFAFLVAKNLVVFILYVWTMAVNIEYKKYLNDIKRDATFILDESEAAGLEVTEIHVNAQNLPRCIQIKNGQLLRFNGRIRRVIFNEKNTKIYVVNVEGKVWYIKEGYKED